MKIEISIAKIIGLACLCFVGGLLWGSRLTSVDEFHRYDVNQDGNITQQDVLIIVNHINRQTQV